MILLHVDFVQCSKRKERNANKADRSFCAYMEHEVCDQKNKSSQEKDVSIVVHTIVTDQFSTTFYDDKPF